MEIKYNTETEDFSVSFSEGTLYIPVRKIIYFIEQLKLDGDIQKYFKELSAIFVSKNKGDVLPKLNFIQSRELSEVLFFLYKKERCADVMAIERQFYAAPQKPFLKSATNVINSSLIQKWIHIANFINIDQIDIVSPIEDYECPKDFIEKKYLFIEAFKMGFNRALAISQSNKINFFLMKDRRHTFLLIVTGNNFFMFDSCGQRYGKTKKSLGVAEHKNDYLHLDEISYTDMLLEHLNLNPEKKLFFNLNALQQDTTNCYTFSVDFIDGFCARIAGFASSDKQKEFLDYLVKFFPIQLSENQQVFHEGALDVLEASITTINLDSDFRGERRLILPPELIRTSQLFANLINPAIAVSDRPFNEVEMFGDSCTLEEDLGRNIKDVTIRLKTGEIITKKVNRRIYDLRKQQEAMLLRS